MKVDFGRIENKRPFFYFHQVQFQDGTFGLQITNNPNDEKGIIDTGFTGNIIFPNKYKAISNNNFQREKHYKLATGDPLHCIESIAFIAFLDSEFEQERILFGKVNQPLLGMSFLENLQKICFNFETQKMHL